MTSAIRISKRQAEVQNNSTTAAATATVVANISMRVLFIVMSLLVAFKEFQLDRISNRIEGNLNEWELFKLKEIEQRQRDGQPLLQITRQRSNNEDENQDLGGSHDGSVDWNTFLNYREEKETDDVDVSDTLDAIISKIFGGSSGALDHNNNNDDDGDEFDDTVRPQREEKDKSKYGITIIYPVDDQGEGDDRDDVNSERDNSEGEHSDEVESVETWERRRRPRIVEEDGELAPIAHRTTLRSIRLRATSAVNTSS